MDVDCAKLIKYNRGLACAVDCLRSDAHSLMSDALSVKPGSKPPLYPREKAFLLAKNCACNGPATLSSGNYICLKCCNNPCCCCPNKLMYCPPVPDGDCRVKTDFFYLRQMPKGCTDYTGKEEFIYAHDLGTVEMCRPRNSYGEWTRTCRY
ncbi:uncharacterized protein LOC106674015 [Cimex lectularius]|uniref:Uncharacterized protein n=1 Tax=Cimex lectularius TaxID=79782 RepID=A0A8I6SCL8_CIMLE|nr:uncharacterized protein LOC106674015 [Cimex lectularius]